MVPSEMSNEQCKNIFTHLELASYNSLETNLLWWSKCLLVSLQPDCARAPGSFDFNYDHKMRLSYVGTSSSFAHLHLSPRVKKNVSSKTWNYNLNIKNLHEGVKMFYFYFWPLNTQSENKYFLVGAQQNMERIPPITDRLEALAGISSNGETLFYFAKNSHFFCNLFLF